MKACPCPSVFDAEVLALRSLLVDALVRRLVPRCSCTAAGNRIISKFLGGGGGDGGPKQSIPNRARLGPRAPSLRTVVFQMLVTHSPFDLWLACHARARFVMHARRAFWPDCPWLPAHLPARISCLPACVPACLPSDLPACTPGGVSVFFFLSDPIASSPSFHPSVRHINPSSLPVRPSFQSPIPSRSCSTRSIHTCSLDAPPRDNPKCHDPF